MAWPKGKPRGKKEYMKPEYNLTEEGAYHTVPGDDEKRKEFERHKQRLELVNEVEYGELAEISNEAWKSARSVISKNVGNKPFKEFSIRDKQKVVASYLYAHLESYQFREAVSKWAIENPGDMMKMVVSSLPKEIETTVHHDGSIVVVPARMGNVQDWLKAAGEETVEGEVVDAVPEETDPQSFWKEKLG